MFYKNVYSFILYCGVRKKMKDEITSSDEAEEESGSVENVSDYNVPEWRPLGTNWRNDFSMLVCASRNSGKTHLVTKLWTDYWSVHFNTVVCFSNSLCNNHWADILPGKLLFRGYSEEALKKTFDVAYRMKSTGHKWRCLVLFDDCISVKQRYSEQIRRCFTEGRHYGISVCFITQSITNVVDSSWRDNLTHLIILNLRSTKQKKFVIENFLNDEVGDDLVPKNYRHNEKIWLMKMLKAVCYDYGAVVIDYESKSRNSNIARWRA